MSSDHPHPWSTLGREEAIESPLELGTVGAAECAAPRQLNEIRREAGGSGGAKEWRVRDRVDQRTGKEDERGPIGRRRLRDEEPDAIPVFHGYGGIGLNREFGGRRCPIGDERPAYKDDGDGEAERNPDLSNASPARNVRHPASRPDCCQHRESLWICLERIPRRTGLEREIRVARLDPA